MDAPVTFATELVSVGWLLKFEFVVDQHAVASRWTYGNEPLKLPFGK